MVTEPPQLIRVAGSDHGVAASTSGIDPRVGSRRGAAKVDATGQDQKTSPPNQAEKNPGFAIWAGMAALRWLVEGFGYEITGLDVLNVYSHTMKAADNADFDCGNEPRFMRSESN